MWQLSGACWTAGSAGASRRPVRRCGPPARSPGCGALPGTRPLWPCPVKVMIDQRLTPVTSHRTEVTAVAVAGEVLTIAPPGMRASRVARAGFYSGTGRVAATP
jgi:hypothetical protein